jgi:hypothetical protein
LVPRIGVLLGRLAALTLAWAVVVCVGLAEPARAHDLAPRSPTVAAAPAESSHGGVGLVVAVQVGINRGDRRPRALAQGGAQASPQGGGRSTMRYRNLLT